MWKWLTFSTQKTWGSQNNSTSPYYTIIQSNYSCCSGFKRVNLLDYIECKVFSIVCSQKFDSFSFFGHLKKNYTKKNKKFQKVPFFLVVTMLKLTPEKIIVSINIDQLILCYMKSILLLYMVKLYPHGWPQFKFIQIVNK
jgi:hypothetical protein